MRYPADRNIHRPFHINQTERPYFVTGRTHFGLPYFATDETKEAFFQALNLAVQNYEITVDAGILLDNHYHLLFRPPGVDAPAGMITSVVTHEVTNKFVTSVTRKRVTSERNDNSIPKRNDNFSCYYDWWEAKYWVAVKQKNINLYGKRSLMAEKKRCEEFRHLLKEGTAQELADFVRRNSKVWYQYTDHIVRDENDYFMHFNYIHQNAVKHGYTKQMSDYKFSSIHRWFKEKGKEWLVDCFRKYSVIDFEPEMGDFN